MNSYPHFQKIRRQDLALIFMGMAFASFGYHLYLWFRLMGTQPRMPDPALGLIYAMNNHGWYYYLSATQTTELGMLMYIFIALFVLAAITYGHHPVKHPWEKYRKPDVGSGIYFAVSLLLSIVALWSYSCSIASFLVSRGIILDPW